MQLLLYIDQQCLLYFVKGKEKNNKKKKLGKHVNPHLCFIASSLKSWSPALKISFNQILKLNEESYVSMTAVIFRAVCVICGLLHNSLKLGYYLYCSTLLVPFSVCFFMCVVGVCWVQKEKTFFKNLFDPLDCNTSHFMTMFRSEKGVVGQILKEFKHQIHSGLSLWKTFSVFIYYCMLTSNNCFVPCFDWARVHSNGENILFGVKVLVSPVKGQNMIYEWAVST